MQPFLRHLAPLACGLLLALPPGWCCLLQPCPARAAAPAPADPGPQCPCCSHPIPPPEAPAPVPPPRCPCADRDATKSGTVKPPALLPGDGLAAAPTSAPDLQPSTAPGESLAGPNLALPSVSLHILHCVWLC
jgi:hypothetical protein